MLIPKPKRVDDEARHRRGFKKLVERYSLSYVKLREGYVEVEKCSLFPQGLITSHYGWAESLRRLEACIKNSGLIQDGHFSE